MSNQTMKAVLIHDYGGPKQLVIEQVPVPRPKAGEVLIRLKAAGVKQAETKFEELEAEVALAA